MNQILENSDDYLKYIMLAFNFTIMLVIYFHTKSNQQAKKHHVLFITSQPKDQTVYFLPTIKSLVGQYFIHILCLSGKGQPKQKQFQLAAKKLAVDHYKCLTVEQLKEKQQKQLSERVVRQKIVSYIKENNIKAIFSFDSQVTLNNLSNKIIYKALKKLEVPQQKTISNKKQQNPENSQPIKLYYLESVNILRKYSSIFEILIALFKDYSYFNFNFVKVWDTLSSHKSQLSQSQKSLAFFDRYSYVNTYKRTFIKTENQNKVL